MSVLKPEGIQVETQTPDVKVHVGPREGRVVLAINEPTAQVSRSVTLSAEQAEMVLHALGFAVARIREEGRLKIEERAGVAQQLLDQEVRRGGS